MIPYLLIIFSFLYLKNDLKSFRLIESLAADHPIRVDYEKFQSIYKDDNRLYVLLKSKDGSTFLQNRLTPVFKKLVRMLERVKNLSTISNLETARYIVPHNGHFQLRPFLSPEGHLLSQAKGHLESELFLNNLINKEADSAITVLVVRDNLTAREKKKIILSVEDILAKVKKEYGIDGLILGDIFTQYNLQNEILKNQLIVLPVFLVATIVIFYLFFGSFFVSFLSLFIISIAYSSTFVLMLFVEKTISPLASLSLVFVFVVTTSDLIHFFSIYSKTDKTSYERIWIPCFYTSLTTFVGFLTLVFSEIEQIRFFGIYSCFGIAIAFGVTFYFLPYIINNFSEIKMKKLALDFKFLPFVAKNKKSILLGYLAVMILSAVSIVDLQFQDRYLNLFPSSHPFSKSVESFTKSFSFVGTVDLRVRAPRSFLLSSEGIAKLGELNSELVAIDGVTNVLSLVSFDNYVKEFLNIRPEERPAFLKLLDLFDAMEIFLPGNFDETRMILRINSIDTHVLDKVIQGIETVSQKRTFSSLFKVEISGYSRVRHDIMSLIFSSFVQSLTGTALLVYIVLIVMFRSISLASIAMIPNIFPVLIIYAICAFFQIPIDYNLIILNAAILGISVDDTIHLMYHYTQRKNYSSYDNLKITLSEISTALVKTTLFFILTFPIFFLTSFNFFHEMALLIIVAFTVALLCDLFVLPATLLIKDGELK